MTNKIESTPNAPVLKLADFWPYQVTVLADRIARRTTKIVKQHDLNLSQWRVLAAIADKPGRSAIEVVTVTPMDKGIVSRATRALLDRGLIRRQASQIDGRISHLYLTETGNALYAALTPKVADVIALAATGLPTAHQERLSQDLRALMSALPDPD